jgi:crossover junction endodeoxyribonuclease RusA
MKPINLIFPYPPSVNTLYFQGPKHGQKFLSKKGKEYKQKLHYLYADDERKPLECPIEVTILLIAPDRRERDIDNYSKALLDGLTDLKYIIDDSQIIDIHITKVDKLEKYNKGLAMIQIRDYTQRIYITDFEEEDPIAQFFKDHSFDEESKLMFHKPVKKYIKKADRIKLGE